MQGESIIDSEPDYNEPNLKDSLVTLNASSAKKKSKK